MTQAEPPLTRRYLERLFTYDRATGRLFWKERTPDMFGDDAQCRAAQRCAQFNSQFAGREALTLSRSGYRKGMVAGRHLNAHQIIWCFENDQWPSEQVDHINGIRDDNRIGNLRHVSATDNMRNKGLSKNNTTGHTGVHYDQKVRKYRALIGIAGKQVNLGQFDSIEGAIAARRRSEAELGYHPNHGLAGRPNYADGAEPGSPSDSDVRPIKVPQMATPDTNEPEVPADLFEIGERIYDEWYNETVPGAEDSNAWRLIRRLLDAALKYNR